MISPIDKEREQKIRTSREHHALLRDKAFNSTIQPPKSKADEAFNEKAYRTWEEHSFLAQHYTEILIHLYNDPY